MNKLASIAIAIALAAVSACGDDTEDIDDTGGIPPGDAQPQPTAVRWTATVLGTTQYPTIAGEAAVELLDGGQAFTATIGVRADVPGSVRPWHVHLGRCASGGAIIGGDLTYPRLMIGSDGTAASTVTVPAALDPFGAYHVNVHLSDPQLATIIACGDLVRL
jgi:hypothetical protein